MSAFTAWLVARALEQSTYTGLIAFVAGLTFIPQADLSLTTRVIATAAIIVPSLLKMIRPDVTPKG